MTRAFLLEGPRIWRTSPGFCFHARKRKPLRRRLAGHGRLGWGSDKGRRQLIEARERARESRTGRGSDPEPVTALLPEPERRFPLLRSAEP